jgi:hypothetical protein
MAFDFIERTLKLREFQSSARSATPSFEVIVLAKTLLLYFDV